LVRHLFQDALSEVMFICGRALETAVSLEEHYNILKERSVNLVPKTNGEESQDVSLNQEFLVINTKEN